MILDCVSFDPFSFQQDCLTAAEVNVGRRQIAQALLVAVVVRLIDLPERAPDALLADKAYDTDTIRADLKARGIKPVIPPKSNRTATIRYSKRLYRQRNCIERVLGHLKINRAIATRYDQLADSFLGVLCHASARYWIKFVHAA